jgi:protein Jumonji
MAAIKKYLDTQNVTITASNHPMVSGVEIDLPALYHAVQSLGGLTEVIQKKKWGKIAEFLRVPKGTQDRSNKFYDIYCKFLLPYDTLSKVEREELLRLVEEEFEERNKDKLNKSRNEDSEDSDDSEEEEEEDEDDECVLKGKSTSLSAFFRVGRNLMSMVFKDKVTPDPGTNEVQPDLKDVEEEYWRLVQDRDCHIQVQQGSIDTGSGGDGYGFPTTRGSSCGRHPWNLKILSNNRRSLLRTMGPVMGVTVPTLHLGMLFTTACWYRDSHGLPWIEYHHTGAPKVWFSVPDSHGIAFYTAMKQLAPTFCRKKKIWLGQDTVMMPPNLLVKHGVSVSRCIQEAGQFIIVFPRAYSSHICTGYTVSESVYYAPKDYLHTAENEFQNIREGREPMMFPLPKLLLSIAKDEKSSKKTLRKVKPLLEKIRDNEYVKRAMIADLGVKTTERIDLKSGSKKQQEEDEYECETCSTNLYVSFVSGVCLFGSRWLLR